MPRGNCQAAKKTNAERRQLKKKKTMKMLSGARERAHRCDRWSVKKTKKMLRAHVRMPRGDRPASLVKPSMEPSLGVCIPFVRS